MEPVLAGLPDIHTGGRTGALTAKTSLKRDVEPRGRGSSRPGNKGVDERGTWREQQEKGPSHREWEEAQGSQKS